MVLRRDYRLRRDSAHRRKAESATRTFVVVGTSMHQCLRRARRRVLGIQDHTLAGVLPVSQCYARTPTVVYMQPTPPPPPLSESLAPPTLLRPIAPPSLPIDQSPTSFPYLASTAHTGRDIAPFRVSEVINPVARRNHRMSPPWPIGCKDTVTSHIATAWTPP